MLNSGFLNTIVLLGSLQGFILSCLLFCSKNKRQANRLLAVFTFLIALACLNLYLIHQDWYGSTTALRVIFSMVPLVIVMPLGPLLFFYIRSTLEPDFVLTGKYRIYFYPVILDLVPQITAGIYFAALLTGVVKGNDAPVGNFIDTYNTYVDVPRWISLTVYLYLSVRYVSSIRRKESTGIHNPPLKWMKQLIGGFLIFQCIWLLHLIPYLIPRYSNALLDWWDWYPLYIPLAIIIYWLGIKEYLLARNHPAHLKKMVSASRLPEAAVQEAIVKLKMVMEKDRLYLNVDLNLAILSEHTGLAPKVISAVLNQQLNKSFNEFVNEYRVAELKDRLLSSVRESRTIAGLAYECGFNSQSTFQRAFKAVIGSTPREYLAKNAVKSGFD